ncbi:MAG TPA: hypothetical protein VFX89_18325 [Gammaproteobacteria bacterium]|nr:hypothetical protein [Gammaproteobacteria bacterium]
MTNRRDFVRRLALTTLGAPAFTTALARDVPRAARGGNTSSRYQPVIAIADRSFFASVEFADEAARHGVDTRGFDGDVAALWLRDLEPALRSGGVALVGLTGAGVLFCLETLARDHGYGVVFNAERPQRGGSGWERVAARHALEAGAASLHGGRVLPPFEHVARTPQPEPPLFAWTIARDARRAAAPAT